MTLGDFQQRLRRPRGFAATLLPLLLMLESMSPNAAHQRRADAPNVERIYP